MKMKVTDASLIIHQYTRDQWLKWGYEVKATATRSWPSTDDKAVSYRTQSVFSVYFFTSSIKIQDIFHIFQGFYVFTGLFLANILCSSLVRHSKFKHTAKILSNGNLPLVWYSFYHFPRNIRVTVPWRVVITKCCQRSLRCQELEGDQIIGEVLAEFEPEHFICRRTGRAVFLCNRYIDFLDEDIGV